MIFIDTDVAIALRDADRPTLRLIDELPELPVISMITRIELENGANSEPALANPRRRLLDRLLETVAVEMFTHADILAYGAIVYDRGYDRRTTLDRLIAAQALARDAVLITRNGKDFRRIEGLKLEEWPPLEVRS
jgi:tRNA(fMet)-specific endonuclease VapC